MRESTERYEYGSEDQDTDMNLIDSRVWPDEPQEELTIYERVHRCVAEIRDIHWQLSEADQNHTNKSDLIAALSKKERHMETLVKLLFGEGQILSDDRPMEF